MKFLELSVPVAGSGKFIQLHQNGVLQKAQPLWTKYCRLQKDLDGINANLCLCNEPAWLFKVAETCRRQAKDFEKQLRLEVDALEKTKAVLERKKGELSSRLAEIDPYLQNASHTLAGAQLLQTQRALSFAGRTSGSEILRRNAIIENYAQLNSFELCKRFDVEDLRLPEEWMKVFPETHLWVTAYSNPILRKRIHKMICIAKRDLRLP